MARPKNLEIRETRQSQILDAARSVFAQQGFAETRMDDIALACGLSKGTLYLYYKSKDDLIAGLLELTFSDLLAQLRALFEADGTTTARLQTLVAQMVDYMRQDMSALNIAYEFYGVAGRRPEVRRFLQVYFAEYRSTLAAIFEQGIERGEFASFDTDKAAITFVALLEGFSLLWFTDPASVVIAQTLPAAVDTFIRAEFRASESGDGRDE